MSQDYVETFKRAVEAWNRDDFDAFAAIRVPSTATVPTRTIPALAHNINTSPNNPASASWCSNRNRLIVT